MIALLQQVDERLYLNALRLTNAFHYWKKKSIKIKIMYVVSINLLF